VGICHGGMRLKARTRWNGTFPRIWNSWEWELSRLYNLHGGHFGEDLGAARSGTVWSENWIAGILHPCKISQVFRHIAIQRWLTLLVVVPVVSVLLGYLLATPGDFRKMALVVIILGALSLPLFLRWHHIALICLINASI
jgi:hypothetical protein